MALTKVTYSMIDTAPVNVSDYGADRSGLSDSSAAFSAAITAAGTYGVVVVPNGTYLLNSPLLLGGAGKAYQLVGNGPDNTILKFNIAGHTDDCVQLSGGQKQIVLKDLFVDCQSTGLDGVALYSSDRPFIENVKILTSYRNAFAIKCTGNDWVENGNFNNIFTVGSGLHAFYLSNTGTGDAFINECVFKQCEARGLSTNAPAFGINPATQRTQCGAAVYAYDGAAGIANKMSSIVWLDCNFDANRGASVALGSDVNVSPMFLANAAQAHVIEGAGVVGSSNTFECWTVINGGWESITGGPDFNGYPLISAESSNCTCSGWTIFGLVGGGWSSISVNGREQNFSGTSLGTLENNRYVARLNYQGDVKFTGGKFEAGDNAHLSSKNTGSFQDKEFLSASTTYDVDIAFPISIVSNLDADDFMVYDLTISYALYPGVAGAPSTTFQTYVSRIMIRGSAAGLVTYAANTANVNSGVTYFTVNSVTPDYVNNRVRTNLTTAAGWGAAGGQTDIFVVLQAVGGFPG
jgi:hypothetical protein